MLFLGGGFVSGYKGRQKAIEARICQLIGRSSEVGYIARIPASITIAIEGKGPLEGNLFEQGGPV